jgi:DNA-binding MarR family transcriptional regulator
MVRVDATLGWRYCLATPNSTGFTNCMAKPKQSPERPALTRALAAAEIFQRRMMALHATEFATVDVTMAQAKLLYVVATAGELSMSEIALRLGVTVSTSSGAVERLVELGLLARSEDPSNRRQVRVSVTPTGTATLGHLRELGDRQLRTLFELVGDEDLYVIEHAMRILADAMSNAPLPTIEGRLQPPGSPLFAPAGSRGS